MPNKIILYATGGSAATYVDEKGDTVAALATLTAANWIESSPFDIGRSQDMLVILKASLTAASLLVRFEIARADILNPTIWPSTPVQWCSVPTLRGDTGVMQAEHTIAPADLVGPSLGAGATTRGIAFLTTGQRLSGKARVIISTSIAPAAGDSAIFGVTA